MHWTRFYRTLPWCKIPHALPCFTGVAVACSPGPSRTVDPGAPPTPPLAAVEVKEPARAPKAVVPKPARRGPAALLDQLPEVPRKRLVAFNSDALGAHGRWEGADSTLDCSVMLTAAGPRLGGCIESLGPQHDKLWTSGVTDRHWCASLGGKPRTSFWLTWDTRELVQGPCPDDFEEPQYRRQGIAPDTLAVHPLPPGMRPLGDFRLERIHEQVVVVRNGGGFAACLETAPSQCTDFFAYGGDSLDVHLQARSPDGPGKGWLALSVRASVYGTEQTWSGTRLALFEIMPDGLDLIGHLPFEFERWSKESEGNIGAILFGRDVRVTSDGCFRIGPPTTADADFGGSSEVVQLEPLPAVVTWKPERLSSGVEGVPDVTGSWRRKGPRQLVRVPNCATGAEILSSKLVP